MNCPTDPTPGKTRLSVLDLLIMIAATAPGLALIRSLPDYITIEEHVMVVRALTIKDSKSAGLFPDSSTSGLGWRISGSGRFTRSSGRPFEARPSYWLSHVPCWAGPCLAPGTLAAMALGLRGPRPPWRRLACRPGMAAGLAMILALAVEALQCLRLLAAVGVRFVGYQDGWSIYLLFALASLTRLAGFSVAAWWLGLALSGRWASEVNAGGRLGRGLGWCWIGMALASELGLWCFALNN